MTDFLITSDASKPAPEFRDLLKRLATPDPYRGIECPKYRAAVDRVNEAFGRSK